MIEIKIYDEQRTCTVNGTLLQLLNETCYALRGVIECIEEIDERCAELFKKNLHKVAMLATLSEDEISTVADFIKLVHEEDDDD